jgi:PAS domain S-box-containing protein
MRTWTRPELPLLLLAAALGLAPSSLSAQVSAPATPQAQAEGDVVVLLSYAYGLPLYEKALPAFMDTMRQAGHPLANVHFEFLNLGQGRGTEYRQNRANVLKDAYAGSDVALIVTVGTPAREFLRTEGSALLPQVPVLDFLGSDETAEVIPGRRMVIIPSTLDYAGTIGLALRLFPATTHVMVVSGASEIDRDLEREFADAVAPWAGKLTFEQTSGSTIEDTLQRTARLPPDSIVVFINYLSDVTGRRFISSDIEQRVVRAAPAPVFSLLSSYLGEGMLGGSLVDVEAEGARAGRVALDILNGKMRLTEPVATLPSAHVAMIDARQLSRWGLDEMSVPEGVAVVNAAPPSWREFIPLVVLGLTIILIQSFWVAKLIVQQRRREAAEVALRESQTQLTLAIEGSRAGLWDWHIDRREVTVNEAWASLLGCTVAELTPLSIEKWTERYHPEDLTRSNTLLEQHLAGKMPYYECEVRLKHKAGHWIWVLGRGRITERDASGTPIRVTGTHLDITQRKMLEADLIQAQKLESIGHLAGGVAHDFNNLLMAIGGNADLALLDVPPDHPAHREIKNIQLATRHAASLTRQLLTFARRQVVEPKVLNVNAVIKGLTEMLGRLIGEDIDLLVHTAAEAAWVRIDPGQMEQVIVNLVVNARDAMPEGGQIIVRTSNVAPDEPVARQNGGLAPGGYVSVAVSDTGAGMSEEVRAHVFEPFFTTKDPGKGTGLGLATCFGIVHQNQGHIQFASDAGRGTTFTVYLPRVDEVQAPAEAPDDGSTFERGTESILLAEDDGAVRETIEQLLRAQGYDVIPVADGQAALDVLRMREGRIHLLVTDVIMPGMGGLKLVDEVQRAYAHVKLLCVSGYPTRAGVEQLASKPGVQFLQKPFAAVDLAAKVRKTLDG